MNSKEIEPRRIKSMVSAIPLLKKAGDVDAGYIALVQQLAGKTDDALKAIVAHVGSHKNEVVPLAQQVELQFLAGKTDDAKKSLEALREISGSVDLDASPLFQPVSRIAGELGLPADWRVQKPVAADTGVRPTLDSLGPFREPLAVAFALRDPEGKSHALAEFQGQPVVFLFFLAAAACTVPNNCKPLAKWPANTKRPESNWSLLVATTRKV